MITKKQHFVWRYYLKSWTSGDKLFCLQNKTSIFKSNLMGVANERFFYRTEFLNDEDILFVKRFIGNVGPHLREIHDEWISIFKAPSAFDEMLKSNLFSKDEADSIRDEIRKTFHEDIHGRIEDSSVVLMDSIRTSELTYFLDPDVRFEFLVFLLTQYFRTSKMRKAVLRGGFAHVSRGAVVWPLISHLLAANCAYNLCGQKYGFKIIYNETDTAFIASDQPAINLNACPITGRLSSSDLELFYPLGPTMALIVGKSYSKDFCEYVQESMVVTLNKKMASSSDRQIYAKDEKSLLSFVAVES